MGKNIRVVKENAGHLSRRYSMIRKSPLFLPIMEQLMLTGDGINPPVSIRDFDKGRHLIVQDKTLRNVFVIRSGIVKCFISEDNGKEYILEFLGEGEVLGEIEAIRRIPGMCTVEALTEGTVYVIDKNVFMRLLQENSDLNLAVMNLMATRLINTAARASRQQLYTLSHSLVQLVKVLDAGQILFTKQDLSNYLGISPRSLNRLLSQLGMKI